MAKLTYTGKVCSEGPGGAWTFLRLHKTLSDARSQKGMIRIVCEANGHKWRTTAAADGEGGHTIYWNKSIQAATGVAPGQEVTLAIELDTKPVVVQVPKDLETALAKAPKASTNFEKMAPSHRKAYVGWVEEAKRPETRKKRVAEAVKRLGQGKGFY